MSENPDISIKEATNELLQTNIFKNVAKRNTQDFAQKLAMWLVRYILIASSMKESLKVNFDTILLNLHGDRFKKIVSITDRTFHSIKKEETEGYRKYIW